MGRVTVAGAPEGVDAITMVRMAKESGGTLLYIARDDARMSAMSELIAFFAPELAVLRFPAWDCLPYDRVSPHPAIMAERLQTLSRLTGGGNERGGSGPRIILTTVNAALQRVPTPESIAQACLTARVGDQVTPEVVIAFLAANGYTRTDMAVEPGDFAVRGGLLDVFATGAAEPCRLDFFGDTLDQIRTFDPGSQRTTGTIDGVSFIPASEVALTEDSIRRFRSAYLNLFGAVTNSDPLYEAIKEGRKHQGMEHWLPLFHEELATLFDFAGQAITCLDGLTEDAANARLEMIADYYKARAEADPRQLGQAAPYKPLKPDALYLTAGEWTALLADRPTRLFSPYAEAESDSVVSLGGKQGRDFAPERARPETNIYDALGSHLAGLAKAGRRPYIAAYSEGSRDRLKTVLEDHGIKPVLLFDDWAAARADTRRGAAALLVLRLEHGFEHDGTAIITEQDILGDRLIRRPRRKKAENFLRDVSSLSEGDYVVHIDHGIGQFKGLETVTVSGAPHDCLLLEYAGGDKLYLPVENLDMLSRYGSEDAAAVPDRLGGGGWQARKAKMKKLLRDMADELIKLATARALRKADAISVSEGLYQEFAARFPYQETDDQLQTIEDVFADLGSGKAMDRLVCGDVGFGKTEVALRSAFLAAMAGHQVAVVTPTTLLCRQHYETFRKRFAGLPIRIAQMSRLASARDMRQTKKELTSGQVDIVIGTHALLAKDVHFRNLGLLIIDEEQHFGVKHKERLKQLKAEVHVLTLSATPIPRTLQMALTGLRELSIIATPPVDRLAVRTFVTPFDGLVVREGLLREHYRGGQSFVVCPRIADLGEMEQFLKDNVPEVTFRTAHGRMGAAELDEVMTAFYEGRFDVLLSTTIIESGLDIPAANTMVVHRADMFGLGQLYQLRGRIGRSKIRGYAYLTVPANRAITANAEKRLKVLQSLDELGAGFSLASHDLDIRGAGNLLGEEQSGHIREVGAELYQQMLEEAVAQARAAGGEAVAVKDDWSPQINLGLAVLIPETYIADLDVRMTLYRRIAHVADGEELNGLVAEMIDRFGPLPREVAALIRIVEIKLACHIARIERIDAGPKGATLTFRDNRFPDPAGLVTFISGQHGTAKLRPDHKLVLRRDWASDKDRLEGVKHLAKALAKLARRARKAEQEKATAKG